MDKDRSQKLTLSLCDTGAKNLTKAINWRLGYNQIVDVDDIPSSFSSHALIVKDRPVCYGTSLLKNGYVLIHAMHFSKH